MKPNDSILMPLADGRVIAAVVFQVQNGSVVASPSGGAGLFYSAPAEKCALLAEALEAVQAKRRRAAKRLTT